MGLWEGGLKEIQLPHNPLFSILLVLAPLNLPGTIFLSSFFGSIIWPFVSFCAFQNLISWTCSLSVLSSARFSVSGDKVCIHVSGIEVEFFFLVLFLASFPCVCWVAGMGRRDGTGGRVVGKFP